MHPFIHPLTGALDPVWEARSDWEIYKAIAKKFSEVAPEVLGVEQDVVLTPILHDTPAEIAQATDVRDWKRGECRPVPGKTMPTVTVVERDYPNLYKRIRLDRRIAGRPLPFEHVHRRIEAYLAERSQRTAVARYIALLAGGPRWSASTCRRRRASGCIRGSAP
jgi:anaerobic selenocysteine-containing dehydrogenase